MGLSFESPGLREKRKIASAIRLPRLPVVLRQKICAPSIKYISLDKIADLSYSDIYDSYITNSHKGRRLIMENWKKNLWIFIGTAYGLFWGIFVIILSLIGFGVLNISLEGNSPFLIFARIFFSWTPTMAVLIHLRKLFPGTTVKEFIKKMFGQPIRWSIIALIMVLEISLNILAGLFIAMYENGSFIDQWEISIPIVLNAAVMSIVTGAGGEESGWRGFLFPHFMKKRGPIISCLFVGVVWGIWHLPHWLLSGYTGLGLLLYIVQFMVCVIDWSVIMGILYLWNRNLAIPMLFHFMVNFLLCFFVGNDLLYQITLAVLYSVAAIVFSIAYTKKKCLSGGDGHAKNI